MEEKKVTNISEEQKEKYENWWRSLTDDWKKAINQAAFQKGEIVDDLSIDELHSLFTESIALRFAGPTAAYPNLTFEIGNLDAIKEITCLRVLVAINCNLKSLKSIKKLVNLESLFVHENDLRTLTGIEKLTNLKELTFHKNRIVDIESLKKLTKLERVNAMDNEIKSLKGLTEKHSHTLKGFYILPNEKLHQKEIIKLENKIGIRCLRG